MNTVNQRFNILNMGDFGKINCAGDLKSKDDIVRLTADKHLTFDKKWTWGDHFSRTTTDKEANNRTRAELLRALGQTLGVTAKVQEHKQLDQNGKRTGEVRLYFTDKFINDLKNKLGEEGQRALELGNFSLKDGYVTSGKPLTERRVSFVNRFLCNKSNNGDFASDADKNIHTLVQNRYPQRKVETFKHDLKKFEPMDMYIYLHDLMPKEVVQTVDHSAPLGILLSDLKTLKDESVTDSIVLDKIFSEINSRVAKHNTKVENNNTKVENNNTKVENNNTTNEIPFFTLDNFIPRMNDAKTKLTKEAEKYVALIKQYLPDKHVPTVTINDEEMKITNVDLTSFGYANIFKIARAAEQAIQNSIVKTAIQKLENATLSLSTGQTARNTAKTQLHLVLKTLKSALESGREGGPNGEVVPKLSYTTNQVNTALTTVWLEALKELKKSKDPAIIALINNNELPKQSESVHLKDLVKLGSKALEEIQIKFSQDKGSVKNPETALKHLKGALMALEPLFRYIKGDIDNSDRLENGDINNSDRFENGDIDNLSKAAGKPIIEEIPAEAPKYPTGASREVKACSNLCAAFEMLGDSFQAGKELLEAAKKSAKEDNRENSLDAVDFLTAITKIKDTTIRDSFAKIFAKFLTDKKMLTKTERDKLYKKINTLLQEQVQNCKNEEKRADKLKTIAQNITKQLNEDKEISQGHKFEEKDVKLALLAGLHIHQANKEVVNTLASMGGGLNSVHDRALDFKGKSYQSIVTPKNEVLRQHKIAVRPDESRLTNLALSEIKTKDGTPLITFNRFGVAGTNMYNRTTHYKQLAIQTFLANKSLLDKVRTDNMTEVEVPIWRVDLAENNYLHENSNGSSNGSISEFKLKIKDANNEDIEVTLKPKVHHFHFPVDTPKIQIGANRIIKKEFAKDNDKALKALQSSVKTLTNPLDPNDRKVKAITKLLEQIEDGFKNIENLKDPLPPKTDDIVKLQYGLKLAYIGERVTVLTSLLGDVPSINCNMGRDRTSEMDAFSKTVALQVHDFIEGKNEELILGEFPDDKEPNAEEVKLRTRMLVETGNWDIARETNYTYHDINLYQSGYTDATEKKTYSGFNLLFNSSLVVEDHYQEE